MNKDDMFDISDEFTKSLERLVEEETNVAKAYVKKNNQSGERDDRHDSVTDIGSTQMFDSEQLKKSVGGVNIDDLLEDDSDEDVRISAPSRKKSPERMVDNSAIDARSIERSEKKRADTKKNSLIIAAVVGIVFVAVIGIVFGAIALSNKNKNSYEYNMEQAKGYFESGDYSTAINYYSVAYDTSQGVKDIDLMFKMYECYKNLNDNVMAKSMLDDVIGYDKYNERAIKALGNYYKDSSNGEALNRLLEEYRGTRGAEFIKEFEVTPPTTSETPGVFSSSIKLSLMAGNGCKVYYTTDGSDPADTTVTPIEYSGELHIDKNVVIKAMAIDSIGVKSLTASFEYKIDYQAPDGPVLNIESGKTIDTDTVLEITNLKEGDTAYYTIDLTTPTSDSIKYEDGIKLEKGTCTVSLVIVGATGQSSKITRYTYIINEVKIYTYEECVGLLKQRMIGLNILQSNGLKTTAGENVSFLYASKQTIDDMEMYIIKYVVRSATGSGTEGYYGVSTKSGSCYKVTVSEGQYSAVKY